MLNYVLRETLITVQILQRRSVMIEEKKAATQGITMKKVDIASTPDQVHGAFDITYVCEVGKVNL